MERALRRGPRCGARGGGAGGRAGGVCAGAWGAAPAFGAASAGRQPPVSPAEAPRAERRRPGRAGGSAEGREGGGAAGLPFSARAAAGGGGKEGARRLCGGSPQGCQAPAVPSPAPWARETGWCQGRGPALLGSRRCAGSFFLPPAARRPWPCGELSRPPRRSRLLGAWPSGEPHCAPWAEASFMSPLGYSGGARHQTVTCPWCADGDAVPCREGFQASLESTLL